MKEQQAGTPAIIYIIRHGEKPGKPGDDKEGGPNLSIKGSARASALPTLFLPSKVELSCRLGVPPGTAKGNFLGTYLATELPGSEPRFRTPDYLFATKESSASNRPLETISPLSAALGLPLNDHYSNDHYKELADELKTNPVYIGKIILICWHHGNIPELAKELGVPSPHKPWPAKVFDCLWEITCDGPNKGSQEHRQPQALQ